MTIDPKDPAPVLDLPPGAQRSFLYADVKGDQAWLFVNDAEVIVAMPAIHEADGPPKSHVVRLSVATLQWLLEQAAEIKAERQS